MKPLIDRLHARLGDFWFYSLMIFVANRFSDAMNAYVGLVLVPKYISTSELGAIMPLTSFAALMAIPAYVFSMTFMKEVNTLAVHREYGKLKTLLRGVFLAIGAMLVVAILLCHRLLPLLNTRIRIVGGSLGLLIVASAFLGCASPIYVNAVRALKKFTAISIVTVVGAPVRLLAMLAALQFRPLAGYFAGQAAPPAFGIMASLICLRKELSVRAEPYWTRETAKNFIRLFLRMAGYIAVPAFAGFVESAILRQQLPDMDSAGYYMATRFSDIANFLAAALYFVLFPLTAENAELGKDTRSHVIRASIASVVFGALLAIVFARLGRPAIALLPHGAKYADFARFIPWLIGIAVLQNIQCYHTNTEASANRFGFLRWWIPLQLGYPALLLLATFHHRIDRYLPEAIVNFLNAHRIDSLAVMLCWITAFAGVLALCSALDFFRKPKR